eukprot:TRINITY_DN1495_c0_g1_i1.p1 TRINITY_DN1495_c0_g1~~TRINITY_DN1495_c0_g1_i1.p1  ORF type:complete len:256 (-),score=91.72 TRINITY_DN1495_c0_g1_i1:165-932(-)
MTDTKVISASPTAAPSASVSSSSSSASSSSSSTSTSTSSSSSTASSPFTFVSKEKDEVSLPSNYLFPSIRKNLEIDAKLMRYECAVPTKALKKIVDYLMLHKGTEPALLSTPVHSNNFADCCQDPIDLNYIDEVSLDRMLLHDVLKYAFTLKIKPLYYLAAAKAASLIRGLPLEKLHEVLSPSWKPTPTPVPTTKETEKKTETTAVDTKNEQKKIEEKKEQSNKVESSTKKTDTSSTQQTPTPKKEDAKEVKKTS